MPYFSNRCIIIRGGALMKLKSEIKLMLIKSEITMTELAKILADKYGRKETVQNLNNKLTRETIQYSEAKEIAEILGYEIEWKKID